MKINNYISQIKHIVERIVIEEEVIKIKGQQQVFPYFKGNNQYPSNLQKKLSDFIYEEFYCQGTTHDAPVISSSNNSNYLEESTDYVRKLSKSNSTISTFDKAWKIEEKTSGDFISIEKNGYRRTAVAGEYIYSNVLFSNGRDELVDLQTVKEKLPKDNGFYYIFGQTREFDDNSFMVRFYFNLKAKSASKLINILTLNLNKQLIPFQFKCLRHPDMFTRTDSAVLYISKMYADVVFQLIQEKKKEISNLTKHGIPLFAYKLLVGVGFAESPINTSISFGQSRADIIAKALIEFQNMNANEKLPKVLGFIKKSALSLDEIWRNPHTNYPYSFV